MTFKEVDGMLSEILDFEDRLTGWESDFVNDVIDVFENQKRLSASQEEKITEIYENLIG